MEFELQVGVEYEVNANLQRTLSTYKLQNVDSHTPRKLWTFIVGHW